MAEKQTLTLRAYVRVDGSTSGPTDLGGIVIPIDQTTPLSPYGAVPVAKADIAGLLRSIADRLDPISHTEASRPIGLPSSRGGQDD